ncbi:hypothetical protein C8F01DRAFT_419505 [Mycena amicta]|nr:hypothetical protein C8F01DRAFT_419505 [Mycena amicta]
MNSLFGVSPRADALTQYIHGLCHLASLPDIEPQVKAYSDAVYFNYFQLGLTLLFSPKNGYKPAAGTARSALRDQDLALDSIDLYNVPKPSPSATKGSSMRKAELAFARFPGLPVSLALAELENRSQSHVTLGAETTGKEFVETMGEPARKGGGAGPSSGSIGIWCEWTRDGLMVEFGGIEATGAQAWERGKDAVWHVATLFQTAPILT